MNKEKKEQVKLEFSNIINKYSLENESDTPDFILAEYLIGCLENFSNVLKKRELWYGRTVTNSEENK